MSRNSKKLYDLSRNAIRKQSLRNFISLASDKDAIELLIRLVLSLQDQLEESQLMYGELLSKFDRFSKCPF